MLSVASGGVPVLVDAMFGLMHNKVIIVDGATVVSESFNYAWSAKHKNAENLLVIDDLSLEVSSNWQKNNRSVVAVERIY